MDCAVSFSSSSVPASMIELALCKSMVVYFRVWFKADVGKRPIMLRMVSFNGAFVQGIEVNDEGDEVIPRGATERLHLIHIDAIKFVHEMTLSPVYATLTYTGDRSKLGRARETLDKLSGKTSVRRQAPER